MKLPRLSSPPSILIGAIAAAILLPASVSVAAAGTAEDASPNNIIADVRKLNNVLYKMHDLLTSTEISADDEVMSKAMKLLGRVRSLVDATNEAEAQQQQVIDERRNKRAARRRRERRLGGGGVESVATEDVLEKETFEERNLEHDDHVARKMFSQTIQFPECLHLYLEDCLETLEEQVTELQMDYDQVDKLIHSKRDPENDPGYNKVVIITNLDGSLVTGKNHDGIVEYPWQWDEGGEGGKRWLGVDGKWDCNQKTPEDCCVDIQDSVPKPDVRGYYIQCHIFVPYGGVGNKKRDDRIIIKLSPDGRVHEKPFIS